MHTNNYTLLVIKTIICMFYYIRGLLVLCSKLYHICYEGQILFGISVIPLSNEVFQLPDCAAFAWSEIAHMSRNLTNHV